MKRKIYWKIFCAPSLKYKGRFLSILILMMLGSLKALVGLRTLRQICAEQQPIARRAADHGLGFVMWTMVLDAESEELEAIKGADVEFETYLTDVTVDEKPSVFSDAGDISSFQVTSVVFPRMSRNCPSPSFWSKKYIGRRIDPDRKKPGSQSVLRPMVIKFVNSAELWSDRNLGNTTSGKQGFISLCCSQPQGL